MQHSMLHTIYTLLSAPHQLPSSLLPNVQHVAPLLADIDPKNYRSWQQQFTELAAQIDHAAQRQGLNQKTVVGFGGGFSAGKSRFINSVLGIDILPEALEPCTAVSTYLTHSTQQSIQACNLFGHQIQLQSDELSQLRHFVDSADSINLGQLIRHIHLGLPAIAWSNIALLDTPGYSKADSQHHGQSDENIALSQLSAAQYVVWLVNAKNGTIRDEDLQFLQKLELGNPIFVVLTQSDLVNRAELAPIMDGILKHLSHKNIAVAGIMAWAAPIAHMQGERIAGDDILEWLEHIDQPVWQSYQDRLDLLMGRLIPLAQAQVATLAKHHEQIQSLLNVPNLTEKQAESFQQHEVQIRSQKLQISIAITKLHQHYTAWSKMIDELEVDSNLKVGSILQKNQSDEEAQSFYEMGELYSHNSWFRNDDKALMWYVKAAINRHSTALQVITTFAHQNNPTASYWLAEIHFYLKISNIYQVVKLYQNALILGESRALIPACKIASEDFGDLQYQIGKAYSEGKITQRNLMEAAVWYKKSAERNYVPAQLEFANYLYECLNDIKSAIFWYKAAANQGSVDGAFKFGLIYAEIGDIDQAVVYMGKAAKANNAKALGWLKDTESKSQSAAYQLAFIYENGYGVKKNLDLAMQKYTVLACKGHAASLNRLEVLAGQKNKNSIYKLGVGCIFMTGLLYFYDGLGFIISMVIVCLFFAVRLVSLVWRAKKRKL